MIIRKATPKKNAKLVLAELILTGVVSSIVNKNTSTNHKISKSHPSLQKNVYFCSRYNIVIKINHFAVTIIKR
jgi:hypothetical protein